MIGDDNKVLGGLCLPMRRTTEALVPEGGYESSQRLHDVRVWYANISGYGLGVDGGVATALFYFQNAYRYRGTAMGPARVEFWVVRWCHSYW